MEERLWTNLIRVYGIVQGVGFRPFVSRIADALQLTGSVANKGSYVEIFVTGDDERQAQFLIDLEEKAPERSAILKVDAKKTEFQQFDSFEIIESVHEAGDIFVSPDIATCPKCKQELYDPTNRRYMHPFINCTACGPRLTILDAMPYDRERTSMKEFPMCPECEFEYTHAETRRYDAQPVCCNDCGPEVYMVGRMERGREAITMARKEIMAGKIIAIKGIGGFHLCCDATNEEAVARLRVLKRRPAKPFAVMMRDMEAVKRECMVLDGQEEILDGHQKPILLLEKNKQSQSLAPSVAPDNPKVGVMLPYAPVQMLLFDYNDGLTMPTDCFVMTSGNISGAPICRTDEDAQKELSAFCDYILSHNRQIRLRADDSVMDFYEEQPYMIRRSRGYAPLPVMLSDTERHSWRGHVLAVGGELKNTFCVAKNQLLYPSPYVGDMADLRTVQALEESIVRMEELLEAKPSLVVCDMHPKYNTTMVAEEQKLEVVQVQHHYAHILSCMAENDVDDSVIGVSFDGTGYGMDGSIWGGEFLICDYQNFKRAGYIKPFVQIGGDASAKEGWRIAVSMLNALYEDAEELVEKLELCQPQMAKLYRRMAENGVNAVKSTSAGRLFDAVSAILGVRRQSSFEGEAATTLQFAAQEYKESQAAEESLMAEKSLIAEKSLMAEERLMAEKSLETEEIECLEDGTYVMPTDKLVKRLTDLRLNGESAKKLAYLFHKELADQIVDMCMKISADTGILKFALSGGVFQNTLLLNLVKKGLEANNNKVYRHHLIPPNDGGLCLGQAAYGLALLNARRGE